MSKDEQAVQTVQSLSAEMIQNHNYQLDHNAAQSDNNRPDSMAHAAVSRMLRNDSIQ